MASGSRSYAVYDATPADAPGSHMPLDTAIHWGWGNPLNAIPGLLLLLVAMAVVALI